MASVLGTRQQRVILLLLVSVLSISSGLLHAQQQAVATSTENKYAGAEECKTCHEEIYQRFDESAHWKTLLNERGGPTKQGCEACHGPGREHIDAGGDKTKIFSFKTASSAAVNERCLGCHASGKDHGNFSRSAHSENNLSCLSCHSSHHATTDHFLLTNSQPSLCYGCHQKMKAQFNLPSHHRVEEGLVKCADCHNPHGGFERKQLRSAAARDSVCFTCHVDKQGPFVFEHPAVKTEGCETCHSPHGSPNPHLLKASNLNIFCLKCHTGSTFASASGTPDFHNQAGAYQACTICHVAVHGSNFDRHFLK
jgi:DmsE family decaheme c-type cytochrome